MATKKKELTKEELDAMLAEETKLRAQRVNARLQALLSEEECVLLAIPKHVELSAGVFGTSYDIIVKPL